MKFHSVVSHASLSSTVLNWRNRNMAHRQLRRQYAKIFFDLFFLIWLICYLWIWGTAKFTVKQHSWSFRVKIITNWLTASNGHFENKQLLFCQEIDKVIRYYMKSRIKGRERGCHLQKSWWFPQSSPAMILMPLVLCIAVLQDATSNDPADVAGKRLIHT